MSGNFKRTDRIAALMQKSLAQIIQQEVKSPKLTGFITISAVKVSPDLGHAKVYFTVFNDDKEKTAVILNAAAPHLRSILAQNINLRSMPQLHFIYDDSVEYGERLQRLIDKATDSSSDDD